MLAEKISYTGFRNIKSQTLSLSPGINILYGMNAQGKTNALEGIYLFAHGKSFRTQNDRDMVNFESVKTSLEMLYSEGEVKKALSFELFRTKRRLCKINKAPAKLNEVIGQFRAVLFCPDYLSIVKDGPSQRRSFINSALCQIKPVYMKSLQRYNHILEQRNALLKNISENKRKPDGIIEFFNEQLSEEAAYIYSVRREYTEKLSRYVNSFFEDMSNGETVEIFYKNSLKDDPGYDRKEIKRRYLDLLERDRAREIALETTIHGIHRDDLEIYLSGREAKIYASQGQQRSIALALKLSEGEISREATGAYPVFLFDDVLSELDKNRQRFVFERLRDRQVVVTSCDISGFERKILSDAALTEVNNGFFETEEQNGEI